jgi:histidine triad (HIT) family protein
MQYCAFCKIVKGELPSYKIYEDEEFLGFLDITPRAKGHTLLIPKKHYRWVYDMSSEEFGRYWQTAFKITKAMQKTLHPEFVSYVTFGLHIYHAHIHIMPRAKGNTQTVPRKKKFKKEEFEEVAEKIYSLF